MTNPKITIIVPVYNAEKSLQKCINNLQKQTFTDYEIILIDDGSTDNSFEVCNDFSKKDIRIRVVHQDNLGVAAARNLGLSLARGKYVMFCDSDDYCSKDWCTIMYNIAEKNPATWIVSNICKMSQCTEKLISKETDEKIIDDGGYAFIFQQGLSPYVCNKIYDREILQRKNISFREDYVIGEDVLFNILYYRNTIKTFYIPEALYYYCENEGSLMHRYYDDFLEINRQLFKERLSVIKKEELEDFCDLYTTYFVSWLENTWDKRNNEKFFPKILKNYKFMKTEEFVFCINHAKLENDSDLYRWVLSKCNYFLYYFLRIIIKIKKAIFN